MVNIENNK